MGVSVAILEAGKILLTRREDFDVWCLPGGAIETDAQQHRPDQANPFVQAVFRAMVESRILPEGSVQLIVGSAGDLLDHLGCQDAVAFTGSGLPCSACCTSATVCGACVR